MRKVMLLIMCMMLVSLIPGAFAQPEFIIDADRLFSYDKSGDQGDVVTMSVRVENAGDAGKMKIECGIYKAEAVQQWYGNAFLALLGQPEDIPNCISGETFVDTKTITMTAGQVTTTDSNKFQVRVPNYAPGDDYVWHCSAFTYCYNDVKDSTGDVEQSDYFVKQFTIEDGGQFSVECNIDSDCHALYDRDYTCEVNKCQYNPPQDDGDGSSDGGSSGGSGGGSSGGSDGGDQEDDNFLLFVVIGGIALVLLLLGLVVIFK